MATATISAPVKAVTGGSFLIEERQPSDIFTPEDFSDEQRQIAETAAQFAANEVLPAADEIEAKHFDVTRGLLKKAGDLGDAFFDTRLVDMAGRACRDTLFFQAAEQLI